MIADLQKQGAIVETLTNYTKVEDKNNLTIYFFTLPNHPAHPFYFKARIVENNGSVEAITTGEGYGDKVETDKWLVEINQIVKRLQQHYKVNKNR